MAAVTFAADRTVEEVKVVALVVCIASSFLGFGRLMTLAVRSTLLTHERLSQNAAGLALGHPQKVGVQRLPVPVSWSRGAVACWSR